MDWLIAVGFGLLVLTAAMANRTNWERRYILVSYVGHAAGTAGLMYLFGHHSDMGLYEEYALQITRALDTDFRHWAPEVILMVLRQPNDFPINELGSTLSQTGLAGIVFWVTRGGSLEAACWVIANVAFAGQVLLYGVMRDMVRKEEWKIAFVSALLVPSVAFWTSGVLKEAWCVGGLGLLAYGAHNLLNRRQVLAAIPAVMGTVLIALVKPYVLFGIVVAVAAVIGVRKGRVRLVHVMLATAVAVGGLLVLTTLYPEWGSERLGDSIAHQRYNNQLSGGDTQIDLGNDLDALRDTSLFAQLKVLPLALLTALFRPLPFEARKISQLSAAIENTVIIVLLVQLFIRAKRGQLLREIVSTPILAGSIVFVLTFSAGIGLGAQNLGGLSRIKVPMMPFYFLLLLVLRRRVAAAVPATLRVVRARAPRATMAARHAKALELVGRRR